MWTCPVCIYYKIDSYGDSLWARNYSDSGWGTGNFVEQTFDGGFIVAGSSRLIKTDSMGFVEWAKSYINGIGCVYQTEDSGYIAAGDGHLLKTNADGDSLWAKGYGGSAKFCQQTSDGGYIVTGGKDNDVYLVKTDSMGDSVWARKYGGSNSDIGNSVKETSDKGYIITGKYGKDGSTSSIYLIRVDSLGDTLWTRKFNYFGGSGNWRYSIGRSVCETPDFGFIIAGLGKEEQDIINTAYLCAIKTDSDGKKMWHYRFGSLGYETYGYSVQNALDSGYVVLGTYMPFWWPEIIVIKIKSDYAGIEEYGEASQKDFSLLKWNLSPFGKGVDIQYEIHKETNIILEVYNMLGQNIIALVNEKRNKGFHTEIWDGKDRDGRNLPSGIYFLKLETTGFKKTGKIFLLR